MILFLSGCGFAWLTWAFNDRLTRLERDHLALEKKLFDLQGDVMTLQRRLKRISRRLGEGDDDVIEGLKNAIRNHVTRIKILEECRGMK